MMLLKNRVEHSYFAAIRTGNHDGEKEKIEKNEPCAA
jgi:hypothetical protein